MSQAYLLVREAHGCIKQRSIFLIAQGVGRAARISFLAATHKHAPLMRPQGHVLCQQTATDHWRASAIAVFALLVTPAMFGWGTLPPHLLCQPGTLSGVAEPSLLISQRHADPCHCWLYSLQGYVREKQTPYCWKLPDILQAAQDGHLSISVGQVIHKSRTNSSCMGIQQEGCRELNVTFHFLR